jgi:hypothetical protein
MVAVDPPTDTAEVDAETTVTATKTESDRHLTKVASPKGERPKPTRTTPHPRTARRPRRTNPTNPPEHETANAHNESESEGAKQKYSRPRLMPRGPAVAGTGALLDL